MRKGIPVSPGVAVARAFCVQDGLAHREPTQLNVADVSGEVSRFGEACAAAAKELDMVIARVGKEVGEEEAQIFRTHRALLADPALTGKVKKVILTRHVDARTALQDTLDEYTILFKQIQDEYLRERMADLRDVVGRILSQLSRQARHDSLVMQDPVIIVAHEILPSQAVAFERMRIAGIITEVGGVTGHAAILARSLSIPAITGLRGILKEISSGDMVALDSREGHVYIDPGPEVESAYRKLQREFVDLRDRPIENRELKPITGDGIRIELLANVNGVADAKMAAQVGADGVGLYRTEYLFLTHPTVPDEEEQVAAYRAIIEASPHRTVTIRTLDLGGDKHLAYLGNPHDANPFMGWRSIRLTLAHPEFFQTQLRAILRAGRFGKVSLLFPMVSTLEEVLEIKKMVKRTQIALHREKIPFAEDMPLGIMLEVPAAAVCLETLLEEVDFVSIGSNDLTQYIMAADRDNAKVSQLCEPFNPALMQVLYSIIQACLKQDKPVTLCGEMAARPRCFLPLFGMGLRSFSMSPAFVPPLKELTRQITLTTCEEVTKRVLKMRTFAQIRNYLTRKVRQINPSVTFHDGLK
jgi:phosphoenolpyruvate-protein phosphotransferase (PTS system enzyme I)